MRGCCDYHRWMATGAAVSGRLLGDDGYGRWFQVGNEPPVRVLRVYNGPSAVSGRSWATLPTGERISPAPTSFGIDYGCRTGGPRIYDVVHDREGRLRYATFTAETVCTGCRRRFTRGDRFEAVVTIDDGSFHHTDCADPKLDLSP